MNIYKSLNKYQEIAHFCTTRNGGVSVGNYASFNLNPFTGDDEESVIKNQNILCQQIGISTDRLFIPHQTHGTEIKEISPAFLDLSHDGKNEYLNGVDGIFTQLPHVCIGITTADCVPLLFFDPIKKVIAAVHAGWRGTCQHIAAKTINTLAQRFDSNPQNIIVSIGPSISAKVYQVGEDVVESFDKAGFENSTIFENRKDGIFLDLWKAAEQDLLRSGVLKENIEITGICTFSEHEKFFSARKLGIKSGRMLSGIMLKE